jgi:hypothetical protein
MNSYLREIEDAIEPIFFIIKVHPGRSPPISPLIDHAATSLFKAELF